MQQVNSLQLEEMDHMNSSTLGQIYTQSKISIQTQQIQLGSWSSPYADSCDTNAFSLPPQTMCQPIKPATKSQPLTYCFATCRYRLAMRIDSLTRRPSMCPIWRPVPSQAASLSQTKSSTLHRTHEKLSHPPGDLLFLHRWLSLYLCKESVFWWADWLVLKLYVWMTWWYHFSSNWVTLETIQQQCLEVGVWQHDARSASVGTNWPEQRCRWTQLYNLWSLELYHCVW